MKTVVSTSGISIKNNRKFKVFLFFLVLTSIIWLLIELSKTYTSSTVFNVEYKNLPNDKLLQTKPVAKLDVAIKAPGFNLLKYKFKAPKVSFNLNNLSKKGDLYYLLPNSQLSNLNTKLVGETEILSILKDTIFIEIGKNVSKKVPVVPKTEIKFKLGYNFIEKLSVLPDSIIITGSEKYIDSIKEISTVLLKLNDIYESIDSELDLIIPKKSKNLIFSSNKVRITGKVDKFTEGKFTIPVSIINEPDGVKVNPFPKQIEVVYQASITHFNKINDNSLLIIFDYKQYEKDSTTQFLTPVIKQKSEYISSLKIIPNQIEFLIQKE
ncbi:YbbR-like protein [Lutibacter oceani]|uniref:YbbR-like protein n=1 Tax=Lutibacter oceani TaxID=1853311 RepID=A0A3D9RQ72_9FLAO|nr:YbbR-like domain-containing protein [Lutibacter oceani]REE82060.1 YbbR-like protein [Lutibacter oceani]